MGSDEGARGSGFLGVVGSAGPHGNQEFPAGMEGVDNGSGLRISYDWIVP